MDSILREYNGKFVMVYIDDINVYSNSFEEYLQYLELIFEKIKKAGLKLNKEKCNFIRNTLPFLGHVISPRGISPDPATIQQILDFPAPRNIRQLRSFLGLAGYYQKFVKGFSQIAAPLFKLLSTKVVYVWTQQTHEAFETLKQKLISPPILVYPDFTKKFYLYTDASDSEYGAVLSQKDSNRQ